MVMFKDKELAEKHYAEVIDEENGIEECECCGFFGISAIVGGDIICGGSSEYARICEDCMDGL